MKNIKIENLSQSFYSKDKLEINVLKDFNLLINSGDFVVIIGESGCGKTTFLNILAGLLNSSNGTIYIDNEKIVSPHFSRSLITQQPCLLPWLNIKENIAFGCKLRGDLINIESRVSKLINFLRLDGFEKLYPNKLSLGMAQRVAFARALIGNPEILLLDEPFAALDFFNRSRLQDELIKIWTMNKFTIVFVTHDIDEAILLGKKIVILSKNPAKIQHIIEINSKYPRDLTNKKLINIKVDIIKKFKQIKD